MTNLTDQIREALEKRCYDKGASERKRCGMPYGDGYWSGAKSMLPLILKLVELMNDFDYTHERDKNCQCCNHNEAALLEMREALADLKKELGVSSER